MGNICNGKHDREESKDTTDTFNKNYPLCQFILAKTATVDLILGTYRCHRGNLLLVIAQQQYLEYSTELRDYSQNFSTIVDAVTIERKKTISVPVARNCPYKRMQLCVLPAYRSEDRDSYIQQFQNMIQEVVSLSNDISLQVSHTSENANGIPNQTLMWVFFQKVMREHGKGLKLTILSSQTKLLNMVRFEVVKTEDFILKPLPMRENC